MSDIKFACPQCRRHIECAPDYAGMEVACPSCTTRIIVPGTVTAPMPVMAQVEAPTPAPAPPMETGPAASASGGCPSCGVGLPRGAVLCTRCGYNLATGQHTIARRPAPAGPKLTIDGEAWYNTPFMYFGAFALVMLVFFFFARRGNGEVNLPLTAFFLLSLGYSAVVMIVTLAAIFKDSFIKGMISVLAGVCGLGLLYIIYWVYVESGSNALKAAFTVNLFLWILMIIASSSSQPMHQ